MKSINFSILQDDFCKSLDNQAKFYPIYVNLFERILFVLPEKSHEESLRSLHLRSLHELCPFFSFDMTNYARVTPVYLLQMMDLKENDGKI